MAGTVKDYNKASTFIGVVDVWLKVAIPAANGVMTIHTDLTPESVANPTAIHLGVTTDSTKVSYKPTLESFFVDQFKAPWRRRITSEEMLIEGNWAQVLDKDLLLAMTVGGALTSTVGHDRLGVGGLVEPVTFSVAVIGMLPSAPTKAIIVQMFQTFNQAGLEMTLNDVTQAGSPFSFVGEAVPSRAAGDQIGYFAVQL